jgi:hypothetical protein
MVSLSNSRLAAVHIGTNVVIRVPDLDRGRLAPRNVLAVAVDVSSSGLDLLSTKDVIRVPDLDRGRLAPRNVLAVAVDVNSSGLDLLSTKDVIRVPDLDRGRLAPRNVLAVAVDVNSSGLDLLSKKEGPLELLCARSGFTAADSNFMEAHDVPSSSLSLRSASMTTYGSKQGFVSCHCKGYCVDIKCECRSKNMKCNSMCQSNSFCKNK